MTAEVLGEAGDPRATVFLQQLAPDLKASFKSSTLKPHWVTITKGGTTSSGSLHQLKLLMLLTTEK